MKRYELIQAGTVSETTITRLNKSNTYGIDNSFYWVECGSERDRGKGKPIPFDFALGIVAMKSTSFVCLFSQHFHGDYPYTITYTNHHTNSDTNTHCLAD